MADSTVRDRTVTRSLRISERALKAMEEDAELQNASVSTILNRQLLSYAEFDRYFKRLGEIKMSSATLERLLCASSDEAIARAGFAAGVDTPKSIILAKRGSLSLQNALNYLHCISAFANSFEYGIVESGGKIVVTLLHRLGHKGSVFYSSYVKALFEDIGLNPKITSTEHSVVIELSPSTITTD